MALPNWKQVKKMFRFLKKLFGGSVEEEVEFQPEVSTDPSPPPRATPKPPPGQTPSGSAKLGLPLNAVLTLLPPDFQSRVNQSYAAEVDVFVPMGKILPQLARGSVKVSFGELRQAAPLGTFSNGDDLDQIMVELPLPEIVSRLNPALLTRRPSQRKVEVPEEITGPFGPKGEGLIVAALKPKQSAPAPITPAPARPHYELRPAAAPVGAPTAIPSSAALRNLIASPVATTPQPAPMPVATPMPVVTPTVAKEPEYLMVALGKLIKAWPEAVLQEITQLNYSGATLALPVDMLENELKHGKVTFTWKLLRSMIQPAPATAAVSVQDGVMLELPLNIITPLFLAHQRASKTQVKTAVAENIPHDIPNLFFDSSQQPPATPVAPVAAVAPVASEFIPAKPAPTRREEETNYYVWKENADTPDAAAFVPRPAAAPAQPGTSFLKRFPTPNEIVRKAAAVEGVVGTLVALADGLLVAKELPPEMNGETLAAFLPQIFGRVSQSTRELKMGELNNLNFTVGNIPWKIFRVGGMFFAAYGRAGEPLPGAPLVAIVAEFDRKPK